MVQWQHWPLFDFFKFSENQTCTLCAKWIMFLSIIPLEFGSGNVSLVTRCITVEEPIGKCSAPSVTLPCRKRPWKISCQMVENQLNATQTPTFSICALLTRSGSHSVMMALKKFFCIKKEQDLLKFVVVACPSPLITGWPMFKHVLKKWGIYQIWE